MEAAEAPGKSPSRGSLTRPGTSELQEAATVEALEAEEAVAARRG